MYTAGQVIDRKEHIKFANWKNANGGNLITVSLGNGTYRIEELEEPSVLNISDNIIALRNQYLSDISWRIERYYSQQLCKVTTTDSEEEIIKVALYMEYLRNIPQQETFPDVQVLTFEDWKKILDIN